ncbi:hypothetical protein ACPWSR_01050 [Alloiococcus sp. CFN-8]|uniref:hypothetical protein n=1 Tax=Alloiococcus sp. CFN-8 TaxID=3416081 RepID=UPI003CE9EA9C
MQYVINSIINMDKEAENYEKEIKEEILKRKKTLNDELSNMESEYQGQIKFLKEQVLADSRKEAEIKAQKIIEAKNSKLQQINEKFQNNKAQIVNSVFQKIINS